MTTTGNSGTGATALDTVAIAGAGSGSGSGGDEVTAKAVHKRYEGLVTVRTKAIKGKGAWYWAHLEPMLERHVDTAVPKAVKLRCSLCGAIFSASNPSRTASEHLKRGTCPNFTSAPRPISSISPSSPTPPQHHSRKRNSASISSSSAAAASSTYQLPPLAVVDPSRFCPEIVYSSSAPVAVPFSNQHQHHHHPHHHHHYVHHHQTQPLMLSGGKEDLGALAMLEDSVKKLKSPKASLGPALTKNQIDSAVGLLAEWLYESCGAVSFSCVEHPKFKAFLQQVGLPPISLRELTGPRLNARFDGARAESDAKIHDALFFQLASEGWKSSQENLVNLTVNLPNGTSVFRKAVFTAGPMPSKYAEEILWETVMGICGGSGGAQRCAGIVADRFKAKALHNLENQHHWMVNLSCQLQGFNSLMKDFCKELGLFKNAIDKCVKLANFLNTKSQVRGSFHKYQLQELDRAGLLRVLPDSGQGEPLNPYLVYAMLEDILNSVRPLQMVVLDESYKGICVEDIVAQEVADMVRDLGFWRELEAVHSLMKLVRTMAQEIELERPLVGQCLPLWNELRSKVKDWCAKFSVTEGTVERVIEKRFKKNYHPAWSAAFILDPLYLLPDNSGKYLPPFKYLKPEQEKDVDKLITRLVSREEAHIALMELMKWRSEGLDPLYAQAVQVKQRDPMTGKMKVANPQSSRLVWETCLSEFKSLGKVAVRLIFLHATACGYKCSWSFLRWVCAHGQSRAGMDRAQKMIFIAAHAKLERRDFSNEEEKDAELFANGEDDVLNEVFVETSSV